MKRFWTGVFAAGVALVMGAGVAAADDLAKIKDDGVMKIAMSGAYPPFNFVNDRNEVVGFDAAIGREIAKRIGVEGQIVTTAWDGILAGLLAKKYDTIVGSMTITPEREKVVDFVGPYYHAGRAVFVTEASDVKTLADLKGKTVGVTLGETHEKWARTQDGWSVRTYKGLPELLDTPDIEGGAVAIGIAIRKNNPDLHAAMQTALDGMMADGTYEKISMEWVGADIR
jgi:polar amino acid transport system substrate-binding protein